MLAAAQAATAASTIMAPCDRLSTPETPKIRVKPVAPRAYNALMAKPSIRIWKASIQWPRQHRCLILKKTADAENAPGINPGARSADAQFDVTLMKLGNFNSPLAISLGQTLICLQSCHCSIRPVISPLPYLIEWVN